MSRAISAGQLRAARALLGWSQQELAAACGVGRRTIANFELGGDIKPTSVALAKLALEEAGITFINRGNDEGVRRAKKFAGGVNQMGNIDHQT